MSTGQSPWARPHARVRAPATSANLGPGFDSLGLCLDLADEVTAEITAQGIGVEVAGEGAGEVPRDETNLVARSMRHCLDAWGLPQPGLRLSCRNAIPHGRGLGSSAAAIVAGVRLAQALVGAERYGDREALRLATELEGHSDNVAACLLGGLTVSWQDSGRPAAVRLEVAAGLDVTVLCAERRLATSTARALLPASVSHQAATANSARAALLVAALTERPDLLMAATVDYLHQETRRRAMPVTLELVDDLRAAGVPAVVSGAGPSVLAFAADEHLALLEELCPAGWRLFRLSVDSRGAELLLPPT